MITYEFSFVKDEPTTIHSFNRGKCASGIIGVNYYTVQRVRFCRFYKMYRVNDILMRFISEANLYYIDQQCAGIFFIFYFWFERKKTEAFKKQFSLNNEQGKCNQWEN